MKRQRNGKAENAEQGAEGAMVVEKKGKKVVVEKVEEEERKKDVGELVHHPVKAEEESVVALGGELWDFDESSPLMSGGGVVVDEQMSWGSIWLPIYDMGHDEMFSDVAWDDDIWNLRSVDKIPDSCTRR